VKDGTYIVRMIEGLPVFGNQINMSDGYWVSDDSGVSVHGELDYNGVVDALSLMDIEDGEIVGIWQNKELSYIDRSYHFRNKATALKAAKAFEQISIWDCSGREEVRL
jgi:hypothetical protein